jgi:hypothetical protein
LTILKWQELDKILTDYTQKVNKEGYAKLPYQYWKLLVNQVKNKIDDTEIYTYIDSVQFRIPSANCLIIVDSYNKGKNFATYWKNNMELPKILSDCTFNTVRWQASAEKAGEALKKLSERISATTTASTVESLNQVTVESLNQVIGNYASYETQTSNAAAYGSDIINKSSLDISKFDSINLGNGYICSPQEIRDALEYYDKTIKNKKDEEKNTMNLFGNLNFGSCEDDNIRMSPYGLAIKNTEGNWVSYDVKQDSLINVDVLNFDGAKFFFKVPVAHTDIKAGDIIIHNRVPMFVDDVDDRAILAIDPRSGEGKTIMLAKSPFGFNYATKVVSLIGNLVGEATEDQPFGNILPLMLMSDDRDNSNLLMAMALSKGGFGETNPLMLYALMGNNSSDNMLPILAMTGNLKF